MSKFWLKVLIVTLVAVAALALLGKLLFVRTVNYEIAGLSIPSKYNLLTGKVTPITYYKGTSNLKVLLPQSKNIGLSDGETAAAKVRWAIFEQWVSSRKQFTGWESDPEIFRKANESFKKEMGSRGPQIRVLE